MAQREDSGAPRRTTTYGQFSGMNSQDARYGVQRDEFFLLENIMRVADGRLHSVPGPNTVSSFNFPTNFLLLETGDDVLLETGDIVLLET